MKTEGKTKNHLMSKTPEFRVWQSMLTRCFNKKANAYHMYGGRGITVCKRWRHSFLNFISDIGRRPTPKHSIERKNNNGDYTPDNCCWATVLQQANNTRTNVNLSFQGRTQTIAQWSREIGIKRGTIQRRLKRGWTVEKTLNVPVGVYKNQVCAKLTPQQVAEIRLLKDTDSANAIGRRFGVGGAAIIKIWTGKTWKASYRGIQYDSLSGHSGVAEFGFSGRILIASDD